MAYNTLASYNYTFGGGRPISALRGITADTFSTPGWGNIYQQELWGRPKNPMDFSLYTNYYSPKPALSLRAALNSEYDKALLNVPSGYSGRAWINRNLPQISTGQNRFVTMG